MSQNQTINETPIPFAFALIPMLVMIIVMGICVIVLKASPHVPLLIGTATAAFIATRFGYTWNYIEEACYAGIKMALPAILIIIMIGLTIGSWIGGGIVATMVYYGLELLSPSLFLFTICAICCVVTLAIGSSWATMGTIGVAAMGIGHSIQHPGPDGGRRRHLRRLLRRQDVAPLRHHQPGRRHHRHRPVRPHQAHALHHHPRASSLPWWPTT